MITFNSPINEQEVGLEKSDVDIFHCPSVTQVRASDEGGPIDLDDKTRATTLDIQSRVDNELVFAR